MFCTTSNQAGRTLQNGVAEMMLVSVDVVIQVSYIHCCNEVEKPVQLFMCGLGPMSSLCLSCVECTVAVSTI